MKRVCSKFIGGLQNRMVTLPPPPAAVNGGETAIGPWLCRPARPSPNNCSASPPLGKCESTWIAFQPGRYLPRPQNPRRSRASGINLESFARPARNSTMDEEDQVGNEPDTLISGSVGRGGANQKDDVLMIQFLFNSISPSNLIPETGACNDELIDRIREFQLKRLGVKTADCRIDAKGRTLTTLLDLAASSGPIGRMGVSARPDLVERVEKFMGLAREARTQKRAVPQKIAAPSGGAGKLTEANFAAAADALKPGVQLAMIRAFAEVESGGKSGFGPSGLPIIAYEGHIFRKYTNGKYDKSHPLLSYPYKKKAGPEWQANNK